MHASILLRKLQQIFLRRKEAHLSLQLLLDFILQYGVASEVRQEQARNVGWLRMVELRCQIRSHRLVAPLCKCRFGLLADAAVVAVTARDGWPRLGDATLPLVRHLSDLLVLFRLVLSDIDKLVGEVRAAVCALGRGENNAVELHLKIENIR